MIEAGVLDFDLWAWYGLVAPGGTPRVLIDQINTQAQKILRDPQFKAQLATAGYAVLSGTPEKFIADNAAESIRMERLIKANGIKPE